MALRSKTDHGNFLVFDVIQIRVFIVVNLHISSCCVTGFANSFAGTVFFARGLVLVLRAFVAPAFRRAFSSSSTCSPEGERYTAWTWDWRTDSSASGDASLQGPKSTG